jgi:hypothetical protein
LHQQVGALNDSLDSVEKFVIADNAKRYDVQPQTGGGSSNASGQVIANPGTEQAMLMVQGLKSNHSLYEVLLESDSGTMVRAGDLPVDDKGEGSMVLHLSQPLASYKSVHIKPKTAEGESLTDSLARTAPDALFGIIGANLGGADDTNAPNIGQSS